MAGCPVCGGPLVNDRERGETVCAQCGLVVSESAVDVGPEWRSFDKEKRVRTAPLKLVVKTDMAVKPEHGVQWRKLARFYKEMLHSPEWKLATIGGELKRIKECVGLPQSVVEEAEVMLKKHLNAVKGFRPEVVAVAVLWVAAKAAGAPRPLDDFLKCSKADKGRVRKAAWRLMEAARLVRRLTVEDYVSTVAARAGLPTSTAKAAAELLKRNKRLLPGKNPWVWAAAALWLASSRRPGLLKRLAEAAGSTPFGVKDAAKKMRI
jgi:Transcription initiation factor TFIIIB, Brf1 subunit/Transcription initiation factor TFIIB